MAYAVTTPSTGAPGMPRDIFTGQDADDVATYVGGVFASDETRCRLFAAAAELVYVAGWMSFDASHHEAARRYFTLAVKLERAAS